MRIYKQYNYTKYFIRIKLAILSIIIYFIWDNNNGIFDFIHQPFFNNNISILGAKYGSLWEWYFRSSLDHWSTLLGMIFALNYPIINLYYNKLESQLLYLHILIKSIIGIILLILLYIWLLYPYQLDKFHYNQTNAYYGIIPLLAYIYFRNITCNIRLYYNKLLTKLGQITLETYLMQHHIWLTSNAKTILILIPGYNKINFVFISIIYIIISQRLYKLTLYLRNMILPENNLYNCIINLVTMIIILFSYTCLAYILKFLNILNLCTAGIFSIIFGITLYYIILQTTWLNYIVTINDAKHANDCSHNNVNGDNNLNHNNHYNTISINNSNGKIVDDKRINKIKYIDIAPTAFGTLCILIIGFIWNYCAINGSGKIQLLPSTCSDYIHNGKWISINNCNNENLINKEYRDKKIISFGTCSNETNYIWGWGKNLSSSHCKFQYRDENILLKELKHRNITFIGDSILRHLYHSTCRQLGDLNAGEYDTTKEKHSDYSRIYESTSMEFRWAPYLTNITMYINELLQEEEKNTDILIVGGGAWDRLHFYNNAEEQNVIQNDIENLAIKLNQLNRKTPIVWVIPTTMNTLALPSNEKRDNIREELMEEFRDIYKTKGIYTNVSFVLDGRLFTKDRVGESYDGVHYPLSIYDAGAQILVNSFDWLLPELTIKDTFIPRKPGVMDNPYLGLIMLFLIIIGLFGFDGFMGLSYIGAIFIPSLSPVKLYHEAFTSLHSRTGLPPIQPDIQIIYLNKHVLDDRRDENGNRWDNKSKSSEGTADDDKDDLEPFFGKG